MGTHYHDQPPEQWAEPVSLDPTPVWKQYILVAALLLLSLIVIAVVAIPALLPTIVTPPAAVPGGRVVLALADMPAVGAEPKRIGAPLISEDQAFYIAQPLKGEYAAVLARWDPYDDPAHACEVVPLPPFTAPVWSYSAKCPDSAGVPGSPLWGPRGEPIAAPRSLARYLVSVDRDRVIVNISRAIREYGATPQPRVAPLSTPCRPWPSVWTRSSPGSRRTSGSRRARRCSAGAP